VWSTGTVVHGEGEGHACSCRWTGSNEGWALGLDWGTREARWLAVVADTWDTLVWGRGRADRVTGVDEDWWDTCLGSGGCACDAQPTAVSWLSLKITQLLVLLSLGLKIRWWWFRRESKVPCRVIGKDTSTRSNFIWSAWLQDLVHFSPS
jgi:hypothetical protein